MVPDVCTDWGCIRLSPCARYYNELNVLGVHRSVTDLAPSHTHHTALELSNTRQYDVVSSDNRSRVVRYRDLLANPPPFLLIYKQRCLFFFYLLIFERLYNFSFWWPLRVIWGRNPYGSLNNFGMSWHGTLPIRWSIFDILDTSTNHFKKSYKKKLKYYKKKRIMKHEFFCYHNINFSQLQLFGAYPIVRWICTYKQILKCIYKNKTLITSMNLAGIFSLTHVLTFNEIESNAKLNTFYFKVQACRHHIVNYNNIDMKYLTLP